MPAWDPEGSRDPGIVVRRDMISVLNKSDQMVLALLESASQAIISIDSTGKIVLANTRTEQIFGYPRPELLGQTVELLLPQAKREAHTRDRVNYFAHPHVRPMGIGMELSGRRKDGTEFPVEVSLSYVELDDGVFAIAFVSDISQRKLLEEQLQHAQKMEAVGRLAGGVAHDFNNMLTVIAGYNRMLLDELSSVDPLRSYVEEALTAADRAAELTNQLLAFSRRQITQPRVVNVNHVISQAEKMLRRLIGEDIKLVSKLIPDAGNIRVDPGHLEQALLNLAVNSRDAMPLGGRLTLETANVALDEAYTRSHLGVKPGEFVMIAVTDNGTGMDAATRRHIFEPFFTTKEKGKGTGLGLATVYGIVQQAGGDIWVYSELGQGTTFKLYFPRVKESAAELASTPSQPLVQARETVLVVEDEQAVRELTVKMLKRLGYTILTAASGAEALEVSRKHAGLISVMLTDVVMPGMSGRQLADALRPERPDMKVLFLSGYTDDTIVQHGVLDEEVHFLSKPFSHDVLSKKLREVLEK